MRSREGEPSGKRVGKAPWPGLTRGGIFVGVLGIVDGRAGVAPVVGWACDTVTWGGETGFPRLVWEFWRWSCCCCNWVRVGAGVFDLDLDLTGAANCCCDGIAPGVGAGNGVIGTLAVPAGVV